MKWETICSHEGLDYRNMIHLSHVYFISLSDLGLIIWNWRYLSNFIVFAEFKLPNFFFSIFNVLLVMLYCYHYFFHALKMEKGSRLDQCHHTWLRNTCDSCKTRNRHSIFFPPGLNKNSYNMLLSELVVKGQFCCLWLAVIMLS